MYIKLILVDSILFEPKIRFFLINFILSLMALFWNSYYYSVMLATVLDLQLKSIEL